MFKMDFSQILSSPYTMALSCVMALTLIFLSLYYGLFYCRVGHYKGPRAKKKGSAASENLPPVSVVLTAQNDAEWLKVNLVYLLEQDYPTFEVVVVDYMSKDDTKFVLKLLSDNYKHLKVVPVGENANNYQGKKYPMSMGVASAKYDILLLADPDCMPADLVNFCWIKEMVKGYVHKNIDIVLGYCGISHKKGLFNLLQQYDNLDYSAEYIGAALMHSPFTGNGRNLSYKRPFFLKSHGFIYHYNISDGADDMFVYQNSRRHNTSVVLSDGSFTMVESQPTLRRWHNYRKHRTITHKYYKFRTKLARMMRPLSVTLFYLAGVALLLWGTMPWPVLAAALLVKLAWQIIAMAQCTKRLGVKPIVYWLSPLLEIYFMIANTILAITPLSKK